MKINNKVYPESIIEAILFIFYYIIHACKVEVCLHQGLISHTAIHPQQQYRIFPGSITKRFTNECSTLPTPCDKMAHRPHLRIQSLGVVCNHITFFISLHDKV